MYDDQPRKRSIADGQWRFANGGWLDSEDGALAVARDDVRRDGDGIQGKTMTGPTEAPVTVTFVLLAAASILSCASVAAALPPIPSMACPVISPDDAPKPDGEANETAWRKAEVQTEFHRYYGGLDRPQEMRLLTDGQWLYIALTAFETGIAEKDVESAVIHIAPSKSSDQFVGFNVTMNAQGITTSIPPFDDGDRWKAAFRQHADRWELEIAIRTLPVFGGALAKGQVFDFNLDRTRMEVLGDSFDVLQQWSNTGTSSGERYRFGEVSVGDPADRLPIIRADVTEQMRIALAAAGGLSASARSAFDEALADARALVKASPGEGAVTTGAVRAYKQKADDITRRLQHAVLVDRGAFVWSCDPMAVPMPDDLPSADQQNAKRLDIRVLGGEWESAALVVSNLTPRTIDGQVLLSDFRSGDSADAKKSLPGWDVVQVRTAPAYLLRQAGRWIRDPLPGIQQAGLFRVGPDQNELLWLTFKSRDVPPGRYTATMTIRSMDDGLSHNVELVLRVYPLALGAKGRPGVNVWNPMIEGRNWAERAANFRDYYQTCAIHSNMDDLPAFTADSSGNLVDETLHFTGFDRFLDDLLHLDADTYLVTVEGHKHRFWPMRRKGQNWQQPDAKSLGVKRWSPRFNEIFAKWVVAFRQHMDSKGLPPDRWAFYIMDEPWPGEELQDVIEFARQVKKADPKVRNYITLPIRHGHDAQYIDVSKCVDIIQLAGRPQPALLKEMLRHGPEIWSYNIQLRGTHPFHGYRREGCWDLMRCGELGTGFWAWDAHAANSFHWREGSRKTKPPGVKFAAIYDDQYNGIVPSLRTEAFREGIEDWKYLIMLDEAIERAKVAGTPDDALAAASDFRAGCLDELDDSESGYRFREQTRSHLLKLHAALGEIDLADVAEIERD